MEYENDRPLKAMVMLVIGVLALSLQDALIKNVSEQASFWQIQSLRSIGNGCLLSIFILLQKREFRALAQLFPKNPLPVIIRCGFIVLCMFCLFAAAPSLNFTQMASGLYLYPLFVTVLAGPVLAEKIGIWRILALIIGGFGAILTLNPWQETFQYLQFLPMIAGFFYACNIMMLRKYCRDENPVCMAFMIAIALLLSGLFGIVFLNIFDVPSDIKESVPFVTTAWHDLSLYIVLIILSLSILNTFGNVSIVFAYQHAESSRLAPVDFCYLPLAVLWGSIIHDHFPTSTTLLGMFLIASGGILTAVREHIRKRQAKLP